MFLVSFFVSPPHALPTEMLVPPLPYLVEALIIPQQDGQVTVYLTTVKPRFHINKEISSVRNIFVLIDRVKAGN